jgi:hypothetical protein
VLGWIQMADNVLELFGKLGIVAEFEAAHRWGLRPWAFQMRRTEASLIPACRAIVRVLQWVALAGHD